MQLLQTALAPGGQKAVLNRALQRKDRSSKAALKVCAPQEPKLTGTQRDRTGLIIDLNHWMVAQYEAATKGTYPSSSPERCDSRYGDLPPLSTGR